MTTRTRFAPATGRLFIAVGIAATAAACTAQLQGGKDESSGDGDTGPVTEGTPAEGPPEFERLGGSQAIECDPDEARFGAPRIWRLTRRQYDGAVATLLGDTTQPGESFLPEPGSEQGFQNDAYQLRVRSTEAGQFQVAAKSLAQTAAQNALDEIFPCASDALLDATCRDAFLSEFGARAFRRPLDQDELTRYAELYDLATEKGDGVLAVSATIEAMLQSPHFLYRFELGDYDPESPATITLTPHEIATALSFTLTESPPDDELWAAAESGALDTAEARKAQVERLLATPEGQEAALEFYRQLFEYKGLNNVMKDPDVFPEFDALRDEFHEEFDGFVKHALFVDDGSFETLIAARYTFADSTLGDFLGLSVSGDDFTRVETDPTVRAGVLSLSGFNAATSAQTRTSPVNRGRFVREKLLCDHIDDPPEGIDTSLPDLDPGMTAREQLEAKTSSPSCSGCHSVMNPVGFGMEALDALGRYRTEDNGLPIDDSGELVETRDADGPFRGTVELADRLASSDQARECFAVQSFRYTFGRGENLGDACFIEQARDDFIAAGGEIETLIVALLSHEGFITRDAK